jgi:hypothetical protein
MAMVRAMVGAMVGTMVRALMCAFLFGMVTTAAAETPPATTPQVQTPADYSKDENWLCRPGRQDACTQDQSTTIVAADGTLSHEDFHPNPNAPIDCFYVYPTVSGETTPNSDLVVTSAERNVISAQFERFAAQCRPYAPMYRQMTLAGLRALMAGQRSGVDRALAYNDVIAAWRYYLAHDNHGRGVVLIGHSQGAGILIHLIAEEIDGKPAQAQLVSAMIMGANVIVPEAGDVGGSFHHIPACRAPAQTGCVLAYVSFRETAPPPAIAFFGKAYDIQTGLTQQGMRALCTNPANLGGGSGDLHSYWRVNSRPWVNPPQTIATPYVSTPGLASAHCVSDEHGSYLAIHVNAAGGPRTDDIPGDLRANGQVLADWGLHVVDIPEAQGDLVDIVRQEGEAYRAAHH